MGMPGQRNRHFEGRAVARGKGRGATRPRAAGAERPGGGRGPRSEVVGTPFIVGHLADALHMVLKLDGPADVLLSLYFRKNHELGSRDRGLVAETVYYALRHLASIAWAMAPAVPERSPRLVALVAIALRFGRRELSEAAAGRDAAAVDAVLAKDVGQAPAPVRAELPDWLYDRIKAQYPDAEAFFRAIAQPAPLDLRVNSLKADPKSVAEEFAERGVQASPMHYSPDGLRLAEKAGIGSWPVYREGRVDIQDEGSQLIARLLAPCRRLMVCDFCAGAGGKTLAIGALMKSTGSLYAFDVNAKRLAGMVPRLRRSGLTNVHPIAIRDEYDRRLGRLIGKFDRVLVDAPCTGTGTLRRNPDLRWRLSVAELERINAVQASVIRSAARLVKKGGRLVYATCSVLREENQAVIEAFLAEHPEFELRSAPDILAAQKVPFTSEEHERMGSYFVMLPQANSTDGFFSAVLERVAEDPARAAHEGGALRGR